MEIKFKTKCRFLTAQQNEEESFFIVGEQMMARTPKPLPLAPNKDALKIWTAAPTAQSVVMIYSSQILLFGAEFTQVYATHAGRGVKPDQHAVRIETKEGERSGN